MAAPADGASSISVTVRVRPFTIREAAQLTKTDDGPVFFGEGSLAGSQAPKLSQKGLRPIIKVVDDRCLVFDPPEDSPIQRFSKSVVPQGKRVKDQTFAFDKVFDENTTQSDVYESTTKNLLDSVLDGYNATVFAYGATGCGKTHTITGTVQQPGIIFLTMQELFERIQDLHEDKVTEISLSYLEIYNETIRDLLVPGGSKAPLMLREDANQAVSVPGLSSHHPQSVQEVMDMIVRGNEYRTMSPTEANATSSRSHAVLQINIMQKDRNADVNEPHTMATLSIIDLAGSERASATKNRGERLVEGANINKSLLALGSCINALCDPRKKNHVPYRNSKLTRLLKFSLGGNCRTVMIVCVSPSSAHFDETQNTLRYANRAKNIQTKVTRNVFNVNRHVKDFLKKIDEQMSLINELKAQQKDYETVAFGKFRKQGEKRDALLKEGIARLRSSYEHSQPERLERINSAKKLRQIERRIGMLSSWITAFDFTSGNREDTSGLDGVASMRKTAHGILAELEQSRSHYHQRLGKSDWQRAIDTALKTGLEALETDGSVDAGEKDSLQKEAELLKVNADRELHISVLEQEKNADAATMQALLKAHFETIALVNEMQQLSQAEALERGQEFLGKMLSASTEATQAVVKPDSSLPVIEAFPPTKAGTPKRKKSIPGSSPLKRASLAMPALDAARFSISPAKASPRRRAKLGTPRKGISFTPKKKSPSKRGVRWRDDTEDGKLAEWSKTPQKVDELTPQPSSDESTSLAIPARPRPDYLPESDSNSSPIPAPPKTSFEIKPASSRFQTGFLSRKTNGSPAAVNLTQSSSSPEPSPLSELNVNKAAGRLSTDLMPPPSKYLTNTNENLDSGFTSESAGEDDTMQMRKAIRRASLSRNGMVKDMNRVHRRRSPQSSSASVASSPAAEGALFTASHARRMVKSDKDVASRHSVLSPRSTPVVKQDTGLMRRATMSEDRGSSNRATSRASISGRISGVNLGSAQRNSMITQAKTSWR